METYLLIGLGGVLGTNARYLVSLWAANRWGTAFPYGTLIINTSGSFALGFFLTLVAARFGNSADARALVATGLLGAYTTFSTFAFESVALGRQRNHGPALLNVLGSTALGIAGAAVGILLANLLVGL